MTQNASYAKSSRALFINRDSLYSVTDKGIQWITDRFVIVRADLLKTPPAVDKCRPLAVSTFRRFRACIGEPLPGVVYDTGVRPATRVGPSVLVTNGRIGAAVNAAVWPAWSATGLKPTLTSSGHLAWFGKVRGQDALFGVVMPIRLPQATDSSEDRAA